MAFTIPNSGCKAIADVRGLFIYPYSNGEVEYSTLASSEDWKSLFTLRGSVNVNQDNPSLDKILVDQFDTPVAITSEPGNFSIEAMLPSFAKDDLEKILGSEPVKQTTSLESGLDTYGIDMDGKMYDAAFAVKTATGHVLLFTHVQFTLSFAKDDKTFGIRLNGSVIAPEKSGNKTIYIACEKSTGAGS